MKGQWVGQYKGSSQGQIIVNIDERPTYYQGVAYLNEFDPAIPSSAVCFSTKDRNKAFQLNLANISPVDPRTGLASTWEIVRPLYGASASVSTHAEIEGSDGDDVLHLSWTTNIGVTGNCVLPRSMSDKPSSLDPQEMDWAEFKTLLSKLQGRRFLFRGQKQPWRLRTSFHRSGRADLHRFLQEDVQILHKQLSGRTKHVFNLGNAEENGAFFNLVQHHGYPTPLLDWTYSPYVAVFFAYRGISNEDAAKADPSARVRILVFHQAEWSKNSLPSILLDTAMPHISVTDFMAVENERMIPQQAVSMVTNIDDVETYIAVMGRLHKRKYLIAFDLPVQARKEVVQELSYMGITAGSMFPGLDGACEELKERNFD